MRSVFVSRALLCFVVLAVGVSCAFGLMSIKGGGDWPKNWPEALEPLRSSASTGDFSSGAQATYYYFRFNGREEFERVWSSLVQVKSKGAPLTLRTPEPAKTDSDDRFGLHSGPRAVLVCPTQGSFLKMPDGSYSHRAEWTGEIESQLDDGVLPQFVGKGKIGGWAIIKNPFDPNAPRFYWPYQQARVEITLYVDGEIIDMNRIRLPEDTPIVDRRKLGESNDTIGRDSE